ncbi:MAG TPA: hypothetical protein P5141_11420, partial [Candidatus Hydrogenedentes bacterium]|nr:hypothetical protein [Candidatus Hydrogenedentota bacterium]
AYKESPEEHSPAVSFSFLPVIANLVVIILSQFLGALGATPDKLPTRLQTLLQSLTVLSNGFILTALMWGSMLALLIDRRPRMAALCAGACAVFSLFGLIHSVLPSGAVYLPWNAPNHMPLLIAFSYLVLGGIFLSVTIRTRH